LQKGEPSKEIRFLFEIQSLALPKKNQNIGIPI